MPEKQMFFLNLNDYTAFKNVLVNGGKFGTQKVNADQL